MGAHVRFGGHFVQASPTSPSHFHHYQSTAQAHVDSTATVVDRVPDGDSLRLTFKLPAPSLLPYLIPKGYVTIDGASLTITGVNDADCTFGIMLIQHTQQKITLGKKPIGAKVNIEVDMVGKYVEKSVLAALGDGTSNQLHALVEKVVEKVLVKKGIVKE